VLTRVVCVSVIGQSTNPMAEAAGLVARKFAEVGWSIASRCSIPVSKQSLGDKTRSNSTDARTSELNFKSCIQLFLLLQESSLRTLYSIFSFISIINMTRAALIRFLIDWHERISSTSFLVKS